MRILSVVLAAALLISACSKAPSTPVRNANENKYSDRHDFHSYGNPAEVRVTHVALDLDVLFKEKILRGSAALILNRINREKPLIIDTRDLKISAVSTASDGVAWSPAQYKLGAADKYLGSPLTIELPMKATQVRIQYETSPGAVGLQWLTPEQTAGRKQPFLFTQSEPTYARTWIPTQDSPGVRVTYSAKIRTPKGLRAVMSARNDPNQKGVTEYTFDMPQAIPPYLIALAVGDLDFKALSKRTGVWAEPSVLQKAAKEFEDTENMVQAAERLYGLYRWEQYDVLILPPSFPYGGMENPRVTFATPTVLAGDKSLVGLIAHELAHSWSGNLVTNATWRDFWLNEGFTTYFERRIQEEVYGQERSEMEALIEKQEVLAEMKDLAPENQILYIDLKGRDPEEGQTRVPYVKGMLLLRRLEELYGREKFDTFLRGYFNQFAFRSIVTGDFVDYLHKNLLDQNPELAAKVNLDEWLSKPGMPADAPEPKSDALAKAEAAAKDWSSGKKSAETLPKNWTTAETIHFLRSLPSHLDAKRMAELDRVFHFTQTGNAEILDDWLLLSIRHGYQPANARLQEFLMEVGRRKYIKPLYQELAKTPEGKARAKAIYAKARDRYHPIAVATIDDLLK